MDLARVLRERLRQAFETGPEDAAGSGRSTNVAAAVNANGAGHVTSVYSDEHVTIIQRDGETEVIHHDQRPPGEHGGDVR